MDILTNILIALLLIILLFYIYMVRHFNYWKKRGIQYEKPVPFFGSALNIYFLKESLGDVIERVHNAFKGPYSGLFIHDKPALLVRDLELIKLILVKDFDYFMDHTMARNLRHDPVGAYMLFLTKSPEWRSLRKKVTPAFTSGRMRMLYELIQESGEGLMEYIGRRGTKPVLETRELTSKYSTHLITSVAFGMQSNCFNDEEDPFRVVSKRIFEFDNIVRGIQTTIFFVSPFLVKLLGLRFVDGLSGKFLKDIFWKTVEHREKNNVSRNDVVEVLLQIKKKEKKDDPYKLEGNALVGQATQFFIAGFETVASTITFTLYELAINQEIQDKVREEIIQFKKERGKITYDVLKEMLYLEACIKETLRKYPLLPFLDRGCSTDYKIPGSDLTIEKGITVYISVSAIHKDPKYYPNPEAYNPDRFYGENAKSIPPFAYLPFGEGPRSCIGNRFAMVSAKSALSKLLSEYRVELVDEKDKDIILNPIGFLISPLNPVNLRYTKLCP